MVEAEFKSLASAIQRSSCFGKITWWREGYRARLGDLSTASIKNFEREVYISRVFFVR
jgi:hypothetical protein